MSFNHRGFLEHERPSVFFMLFQNTIVSYPAGIYF